MSKGDYYGEIGVSRSKLMAALAEFDVGDESEYLSEAGFVEARREAVRQQRRLVNRAVDGGFLCAPSNRKSAQRHRVWQPDDVRCTWTELDDVAGEEGARKLAARPTSAVVGGRNGAVTERFAGLGQGGAALRRPGSAGASRRSAKPRPESAPLWATWQRCPTCQSRRRWASSPSSTRSSSTTGARGSTSIAPSPRTGRCRGSGPRRYR